MARGICVGMHLRVRNLCSMQDANKEIICFLQFDSSEKLQEMLKAQEKYGDLFKHEYRNEDPITTPSDFENNLRNVQYHFKSPIPTCYSNFMIYRTYRVGSAQYWFDSSTFISLRRFRTVMAMDSVY